MNKTNIETTYYVHQQNCITLMDEELYQSELQRCVDMLESESVLRSDAVYLLWQVYYKQLLMCGDDIPF